MKIALVVMMVTFFSGAASAAESMLMCDINSSFTEPNGKDTKESGKAIIEVTDDSSFKYIRITSDAANANGIFVATRAPLNYRPKYVANDASTDSKWDIKSINDDGITKYTTRVMINRLTGYLLVDQDIEKLSYGVSRIKVVGECRKSEGAVKKF